MDFANMPTKLQDKIGDKIGGNVANVKLLMVTSGAALRMFLGTAATIKREQMRTRRKLLPNLPGPVRKVIMQKSPIGMVILTKRLPQLVAVIVEVDGRKEMQQLLIAYRNGPILLMQP